MRVSELETTVANLEAAVRDLEPATLTGDAARGWSSSRRGASACSAR